MVRLVPLLWCLVVAVALAHVATFADGAVGELEPLRMGSRTVTHELDSIEYIAGGHLVDADEETLLHAALLAETETPLRRRQQRASVERAEADAPRMYPVTELVDALADPIASAQDQQHDASSSFLRVDASASLEAGAEAMTAAQMMARFGYIIPPAPRTPLPNTVQNYCLPPDPKKYGHMFIFKMTCDKDANGNVPVGGKCQIQCNPSDIPHGRYYVLSGSQYRCVQPDRTQGAELIGDQECMPGCAPFTYDTFKADFTETLERFGSYHALPGGCSVPIAENQFCDIECVAGEQRVGTRFYCHPGSMTLTGTQRCRTKSEEDKKRREALNNDPAAKAAYQAQKKAEGDALKAAKGGAKPKRRLLSRLTEEEYTQAKMDYEDSQRATALAPEELTPSMIEQMAQAVVDLQEKTLDDLASRAEIRGAMRARMTRHWQTPRFADHSMAEQMFDSTLTGAAAVTKKKAVATPCTSDPKDCPLSEGVKQLTEGEPTVAKSGAFREYVAKFLGSVGKAAYEKSSEKAPEIYVAIGSEKVNFQYGESGPQKGDKIKEGKISYVGIAQLIQQIVSKKKLTTEPIPIDEKDKTKLTQVRANWQREDQCKTLPIDQGTTYSFFSLMIDDNSLCFVWTGKGTFGVFFQLGDFLKDLIPPPFNLLLGGGLAISTSRELRMEEYRKATFGFGDSLEEGGHLIVPASCYTSIPAAEPGQPAPTLMGNVMGPTGIGCKGHVWAQLNIEYDPLTELGTGKSRVPQGSLQNTVDKAGEKDKLVLKIEGRASMLLDFAPNPVTAEESATISEAVAELEADRQQMSVEDNKPVPTKDGKPPNKLLAFIKGAMEKMKNNGFTALIDADLKLTLEANFIAAFKLELAAIARIMIQAGTTVQTPLGHSADGVYIKVGVHAGLEASTKDESTSASGAVQRLNDAKKSIAKLKKSLGGLYKHVRTSQPGNSDIAKKPVFSDHQFDPAVKVPAEEKGVQADVGMDITFQFNGDGFAIAIEAVASAVVTSGEKATVSKTGAGVYFRIGLDGVLELCVLWGKTDKCRHTNMIMYMRKVTKAIKEGVKKGFVRVVDWMARRPRKPELTSEPSTRHFQIEKSPYQLIHRFDQDVAWLKWMDQEGDGIVRSNERCVSLVLYEEVRKQQTTLTSTTLDKVLAADAAKDPKVVTSCALPESKFDAPPGMNRWTEKQLETAFGQVTSDNYQRYLDLKAKWSKACTDAKGSEAACRAVAPKGAINECQYFPTSWKRWAANCFLSIQPDFNPEDEYDQYP